MGIKGLLWLITNHKDRVFTPSTVIKGKLLVDGYSVLHELYASCTLEWASGGCYADQHKATLDYFKALVEAGVEPIVIIDGGGTETNISDTIYRRNRDINDLPALLRKQHKNRDCQEYRSHHFPLLSRHVYMTTLKQLDGVHLYIADGKAHQTVVDLANHLNCPVLSNNTNYCISGVAGGLIFFKDLDISTCTAPIYKQTELISLLNLEDPDLIFAVVAILGDGCDTSVPVLYHGGIREDIKRVCTAKNIALEERSYILNIVDYLKACDCRSFKDFKEKIDSFNFGYRQRQKLAKNCRTVEEVYRPSTTTQTIDILKTTTQLHCSGSCGLPENIVRMYRQGSYPVIVMNAVCIGKCTLDSDVGDPEQPPVPKLGRYIRRVMYGLASLLMSRSFRNGIEEYYRSVEQNDSKKPWKYVAFKEEPLWRYKELSSDRIFDLEKAMREETAKSVICEVLRSPEGILQKLNGALDNTYLLGVLTTHYWAQYLFHSKQEEIKTFDHPDQLIRALVLNFLFSPEKGSIQLDLYSSPMWIKVYHALLEWQSLYHDVCGLNSMLLSPFLELPLSSILDGSFVIETALNPNPEIIITYKRRLSPPKQELYDRIIEGFDLQ